jgi:hypothetical protein
VEAGVKARLEMLAVGAEEMGGGRFLDVEF